MIEHVHHASHHINQVLSQAQYNNQQKRLLLHYACEQSQYFNSNATEKTIDDSNNKTSAEITMKTLDNKDETCEDDPGKYKFFRDLSFFTHFFQRL